MEFIHFPEATHKAKGLSYHFDPEGYIVLALKFDNKDIRALRRGESLYIITGPRLTVPPPMQITLANPFKPLVQDGKLSAFAGEKNPVMISMIPNHEKDNPKGPGDDKQPHEGDS